MKIYQLYTGYGHNVAPGWWLEQTWIPVS